MTGNFEVNGFATVEVGGWFGSIRPRLGGGTPRAEVVAVDAVAHIEGKADDRPQHRVRAVQELPVDNGVKADVDRDLGGAPAIPAQAMTIFGGLIHRTSVREVGLGTSVYVTRTTLE